MKTLFTLLLLVAAVVARADTPTAAKVKLRELAKMPLMSLPFGFGFDQTGFTMEGEPRDLKAEMAAVRAAMQGGPSDAELYVKLSELQKLDGADDKTVRETKETAISLYRRRLAAQPDNGRIMAELSELLSLQEEGEEKKTLLHRAVQVSPNEWRCWIAMGNYNFGRAIYELFDLDAKTVASPLAFLGKIANMKKPSPERVKRAQELIAESQSNYDKAVAVAPQEPEVYRVRAINRMLKNVFELLSKPPNPETGGLNPQKILFSPEVFSDLKQMARLDPKNYRVIGTILLFETSASLDEKKAHNDSAEMIDMVPENVQRSIRELVARLEELADGTDKKAAFGALVVLGGAKALITGNLAAAEKDLRRALVLQPTSELATKLLVATLMMAKSHDEALIVCRAWAERAPSRDSALYLARAYYGVKQYDKAEAQLDVALKIAPGDFKCLLAMASVQLRKPDEQSSLKAWEYLQKAREAFDKLPEKEQTDELKVELFFRLALCYALNDQVSFARKGFNQILEHDKDNKEAKEALVALDALQK